MDEFPLYRKYKNEKSYFKVISPDEFEEIVHIGRAFRRDLYKAKILPERNLIADLIALKDAHWEAISKREYNEHLERCEKELYKMKGSL